MGVASMVIGIISTFLGFFSPCNWFALISATMGLVLGIVDVTRKSKPGQKKGQGMGGIVLNAAAIVIILLCTLFFATAVSEEVFDFLDFFK